jgi:hypothetical protein
LKRTRVAGVISSLLKGFYNTSEATDGDLSPSDHCRRTDGKPCLHGAF